MTCFSPFFCRRTKVSRFPDIDAQLQINKGSLPYSGRYHVGSSRLNDDYVLTSESIGEGMNGSIRLATSKVNPEERFAVKSFDLNESKYLEQIETEVKVHLHMEHPHIARLFDIYESTQRLHLVLECLEGGDLLGRVKEKKRFSEDEARKILTQLLLAVKYMHKRGVIHRDIKLENIAFDKHGCVKLIDFGLSAMLDPRSGEKLTKCCGTMEYCAPEVFSKSYTEQCDLWSAGVVGFILLSGRMPFNGPRDVMRKRIRKGVYSMSSEHWNAVSEDAKSFIRSLLEISPSKRLSAAEALEHPWISGNAISQVSSASNVDAALDRVDPSGPGCICLTEFIAFQFSGYCCASAEIEHVVSDVKSKGLFSTLGTRWFALSEKIMLFRPYVKAL